ncbi:2-isopropylmalate synthase [Candidatus Marinimicrobia bacterium MT.SAG.3]|nr:2-isopropylmalate synthase [Candidatus Marinimicrobia bacterium MT.SAG.3]
MPDLKDIEFDDETLRDGLQSPSVQHPTIEQKKELLHLMEELGIHTADVGLPGAGARARNDVLALVQEIADSKMNITPNCAARTVLADVTPVVEISQKVGIPIEVCTFIGSSPIRVYAEEWTLEKMVNHTVEAVSFVVKEGLPVMFVTEDTVRAKPETLTALFDAAIDSGAARLCLCDTCGHATPIGVKNLVNWTKEYLASKDVDIKLDWHGHRDRGLALSNALAAIEAGVDRVHGTAMGIGERIGNLPIDILLVNLRLLGLIENDLTKLPEYVRKTSEYTGIPLPPNYPVIGEDAFRTGTGVHAAAVIKAESKGDDWLADRIYSGVPAGMVGRHQIIDVGPMSGKSNVIYWLKKYAIEPSDELVNEIFKVAKNSEKLLTEDEIMAVVERVTN